MALQFQHFFAGVGMRRIEINGKTAIDHAAIGLNEIQIGRLPWTELAPFVETADRMHERPQLFA